MNTFAERLRLAMAARGFNQAQLAERSGLTEAAISRYLKGERQPRMATVSSLAQALQVPAWELMDENPQEISNIDDAIRLIARNSGNLSSEQKELIFKAVVG